MADIEFESLEKLQEALGRLSAAIWTKIGERAGLKIGEQLRHHLVKYPGPPSHPIKWASRKQRAWYFAMRREAGLSPDYTRTSDPMSQKLGQSWATEAIPGGAVVGTRVSYAPYVQSEQFQQPMHAATGWKTDADAVGELERSKAIERIVLAEIDSYIREILK